MTTDRRKEAKSSSTGRIIKWDETKVPLPVIPNANYASFMLQAFTQRGEEEAVIDAITEKSYTYGDLSRMIPSLRNGLAAAGVQFGDAVILITSNHVDVPIIVLGIMLAGAICVPISPAMTKEELTRIITVSEAKWAVAHLDVAEAVEGAFQSVAPGSLKEMWTIGGKSHKRPALAQLMSFSSEPHLMEDKFNSATTVALMPFSTGTTGLPKGVMLSHRNLLVNLVHLQFARRTNPHQKIKLYEIILLVLPMYHIYGFNNMMNTIFLGGKLILLPRFSPESYFRAIEKYKVTYTPIVPYIIKRILETPSMKAYDLSSLVGIGTGSAPVSGVAMETLAKKSGKPALQGWALTESSGICTTTRSNTRFKPESVGIPYMFFEMKVSPTELENIIKEVEGVNDVAVAGVPHDTLGEAPRAWIVPNEGATINTRSLIKHVADRVAPYKRLAGGVEFVKTIPRNHLLKIVRRDLQKSYKSPQSKL